MEKKSIKISLKLGIVLSVLAIIVCSIILVVIMQKLSNNNNYNYTKKDDWEYDAKKPSENTNIYGGTSKAFSPSSITGSASLDSAVSSESTNGSTIGFSTGGAKDINSFRENIKNGYFPISTDITYNGLFYNYVFDTGAKEESKELFSPSY